MKSVIVYAGKCYGRPHDVIAEGQSETMVKDPHGVVFAAPNCDIESLEDSVTSARVVAVTPETDAEYQWRMAL